MAAYNKLRGESSRLIYAILVESLHDCREGDLELVTRLELSLSTIQKLDRLKADQITGIAEKYVRDVSAWEIFPFDPKKMTRIIEIEASEAKRFDMIDEFLRHGACKDMMYDLFGMRSTQVASRKRYLSVPTVKGRLPATTTAEQRTIYDVWLINIIVPDYRERLLTVARTTGIALSQIYRETQLIEQIANSTTTSRQMCA